MRKRRLSGITSDDVRSALRAAGYECLGHSGKAQTACFDGIRTLEKELERRRPGLAGLSGRPSLVEFLTARGIKKAMFSDIASEVSLYTLPEYKARAEVEWAGRKRASCARLRALPRSDEAAMTRGERAVCDAVDAWLKVT